jgi:hypothetical protein
MEHDVDNVPDRCFAAKLSVDLVFNSVWPGLKELGLRHVPLRCSVVSLELLTY